jgi:hypothetical protein
MGYLPNSSVKFGCWVIARWFRKNKSSHPFKKSPTWTLVRDITLYNLWHVSLKVGNNVVLPERRGRRRRWMGQSSERKSQREAVLSTSFPASARVLKLDDDEMSTFPDMSWCRISGVKHAEMLSFQSSDLFWTTLSLHNNLHQHLSGFRLPVRESKSLRLSIADEIPPETFPLPRLFAKINYLVDPYSPSPI